ncbi:hypothetical protein [Aquiflexum gelatinilyticum]|uniref:hypothetical protein n=1 Tax=Aquiflexum gelatinilyticum TaxID=2961943 RepID=UPI00216A0F9B|nr:hypothetical protein [Aquiflexum gelatinilyticum]MCS4435835.1 hypothetical protein [Aquiflexum gelatinilyticum]
MKNILLTIIFLGGFYPLFAQDNTDPISLLISSRVDTTSEEINAIIKLYENYYRSKPDSVYDNPYWNKKEKTLYKDFDFSRISIFQGGMDANTLFQYFSPFVLSVEPIGAKYQIRVLFSSATTDPKYAGSKVWCIQKLNAVKEGESWVLENLIVELSKGWSSKKLGCIDYIFPPTHEFDIQEAERAKSFCEEIIRRFNPGYDGEFKYYITSSMDDMGLLENFDYYFVGITSGKAREGMILTAKGNEFYPHEFIHKLLPSNPKRNFVIEEGIAQFLGTKENKEEYESLMNKLAVDLEERSETINFKSVISQSERFNGYQTAYPAGAAICELVHGHSGDQGLLQLLMADTMEYKNLVTTICLITKLSEQELEMKWSETLKKYRNL